MNGRTLEQLESRLCLSSHHGGDLHFQAMHHGGSGAGVTATATPTATTTATITVQATPRMPMAKPQGAMPGMHGGTHKFGGGGPGHFIDHDGGDEAVGGNYTVGGNSIASPQQQHPIVVGVAVIPILGGALLLPVLRIPPMPNPGTPAVETPAASANDNGGGARTLQAPAVTPPSAVTRDVRIADASPARQLLAETGNLAARDNGCLAATAARSAFGALGTSPGSVMERLTSKWHDGIVAAAVDVAQANIAHLIASPEALVSTALDAASNLLAPVARTAGAVMSAGTPVASVTSAAAYDIAHMGSPFALLADSLAGFVEESASVNNIVAQADKRGPWTLTAGVIAADVVVLTYVYRRKSTRRRAQLAPVGIA